MSSTSLYIILSTLLLSTSSASAGIRGAFGQAQLKCTDELELSITCTGDCTVPQESSPPTNLNYQIGIKSLTDKSWQLTRAMMAAGSAEYPLTLLSLPDDPSISSNEPLQLPWSIRSDQVIGETPILQAIAIAKTAEGYECQLDTNEIKTLPSSGVATSSPTDTVAKKEEAFSIPVTKSIATTEQATTAFTESSTKTITMFLNYGVGSGTVAPTSDDYTQLVLETTNWMTDEVERLFGSDSRELQDVSLDIAHSEHKPNEELSLQLRFDVKITWAANTIADIPSSLDYFQRGGLVRFNTGGYQSILRSDLPEENVFQKTEILNGSLAPHQETQSVTESLTKSVPQSNSLGVTKQATTAFPESSTKTIIMFLNYKTGAGEPTGDDYEQLVTETNKWMTDEVARLYDTNNRKLQAVSVVIDTAEYNPSESHSQQIRFEVEITWEATSLADIPSTWDILKTNIAPFDTVGYMTQTLVNLPEGNIFRATSSLNGSFAI